MDLVMRNVFAATALAAALAATALSPAIARMSGQSRPMMGRVGAMIDGCLPCLKANLDITETQTVAWDGCSAALIGRDFGAM
jgi:hypothetical protein